MEKDIKETEVTKKPIKPIVAYIRRFNIHQWMDIALLLLYVFVIVKTKCCNDPRYGELMHVIVVAALIYLAYIGHRSRLNPPMFLGRPLTNNRDVALRNYILNAYSVHEGVEDNISPKSLAMLTAVLIQYGFLSQSPFLRSKVIILFKELGRENEIAKYQSINRYLTKEFKFINPNCKGDNTDDLEAIFNSILNN